MKDEMSALFVFVFGAFLAISAIQVCAIISQRNEGIDAAVSASFKVLLSVLIPVFNKAESVGRSLMSALNVPIPRVQVCVVCLNDGSEDNSLARIMQFQDQDPRIALYWNPVKVGTHRSRLRLVELTKTPYLVFLDPDDQFGGNGIAAALKAIQDQNADIVEFGSHGVPPDEMWERFSDWRTAQFMRVNATELEKAFYAGKTNFRLHRKIIRADLYREAIAAMPDSVKQKSLDKDEDQLQYPFLVSKMQRDYAYVPEQGAIRHFELPDNSLSQIHDSEAENVENDAWISRVVKELLDKMRER
jgi:glycosyltransferase involved in cell wall biosynthesis